MMRSLYSGVSGLRNHQTRMDVIGNNIANVNTTAYKTSRTVFQDIYSQTISAASAGTATLGGTNPSQIGLGVMLGTIDTLFTNGATQRTDNPSDLRIDGDGFFVIDINGTDPAGIKFTRAGNFYVDNVGKLVTSDGYFVMGYTLYTPGTGNPPTAGTVVPLPDLTDPAAMEAGLAQIDLSAYTNISFDSTGTIWGYTAAGDKVAAAQIAMSMFTNNSGLEKAGGSLYNWSASSGSPTYTISGSQGAGGITPGALEMANVDLAAEFTDMIITQRGFQANSRVITVSDTLLEELINLKR